MFYFHNYAFLQRIQENTTQYHGCILLSPDIMHHQLVYTLEIIYLEYISQLEMFWDIHICILLPLISNNLTIEFHKINFVICFFIITSHHTKASIIIAALTELMLLVLQMQLE